MRSASPIEHELVCPNGHEAELIDGVLVCIIEQDPPDLTSLDPCTAAEHERDLDETACCGCTRHAPRVYATKDLVRSGRTRPRQFTDAYQRAARSGVWPNMATREKWMVSFR